MNKLWTPNNEKKIKQCVDTKRIKKCVDTNRHKTETCEKYPRLSCYVPLHHSFNRDYLPWLKGWVGR